MDKKKQWGIHIILILVGLIWAFCLIKPVFGTMGNGWISETRVNRLEDIYRLLLNGEKRFDFSMVSHTLGYGLYFPFIMRFFNISSGMDMFMFVQSLSGAFVLIIYPSLIYALTRQILTSLLSPLIVHITVGDLLYINKSGEFSAGVWVVAIGIPLLYILCEKVHDNSSLFGCSIALMIVMMAGNVMRSQSALPILLALMSYYVFCLVKKNVSRRSVALLVLLLLCSYNLLGRTVPECVAYSWNVDGTTKYNSSPWHSILIGMGSVDNDWGLYYGDDCGRELICGKYPGVTYLSDEYFEKCKVEVINIIRADPFFFIRSLLQKWVKCLKFQFEYATDNTPLSSGYKILVIILTLCMGALDYVLDRTLLIEKIRQCKGLFIGTVIISQLGLLQAILAAPSVYYGITGISVVGIVFLFLLILMMSVLEHIIHSKLKLKELTV